MHWICACDRLAFVDQGTSQDEVDRFAFSPKQSDGLPVASYVGNRLAAFSLLVQQVHRKSWWCTFSSSFMEGRHVASSRGVGLERIYADRALGGHCNYCGFDCVTFAGGPGRAGSCAVLAAVHEQSEAVGLVDSELSHANQRSAGGEHVPGTEPWEQWLGLERELGGVHASEPGADAAVQCVQFLGERR